MPRTKLSAAERRRLLALLDDIMSRAPTRSAVATDRELAAIRAARRQGGRRSVR